jgi:hypothetical protein
MHSTQGGVRAGETLIMNYTTRIDHPQRLVVFQNSGEITQDDLGSVLTLFRDPAFPADYDMITLFEADVSTNLDHTALVHHAIERQRTLSERTPEQTIRSALVAVPDGLKSMLELWPLFFPDSDNSLKICFFDTLEEALVWLDRRPINVEALLPFPSSPTE